MKLIDADKLLRHIENHAYLVAYDKYSEEMGMTMTGIRQCIDDMVEDKDVDMKTRIEERCSGCIFEEDDDCIVCASCIRFAIHDNYETYPEGVNSNE